MVTEKNFFDGLSDTDIKKMINDLNFMLEKRQMEKEQPKQKEYTFSGTWTYCCWAYDLDEAKMKFDSAFLEELDIDTDHYEVEEE